MNEVKNPTAATPMKINDSDSWLTLTNVSSETDANLKAISWSVVVSATRV